MKLTIIAEAKTQEIATQTSRTYVFTQSVQTISYSTPVVVKVLTNASIVGGGGSTDLEWITIVNSSNINLLPNQAYAINTLSLAIAKLPATAVLGQKLAIYSLSTSGWRLTQGSGQQVKIGDKVTTAGETGRVDSMYEGDYLELVYLPPLWVATDIIGNLEVV